MISEMPSTTLVVSPHLDDAVLSLGGTIAGWSAAGERVVIASVYTAGPPLEEIEPSMRCFADYATRRAEDAAACAQLGAEPRYLDQIERAFRKPYLSNNAYFTTPPDRSGFGTLEQVKAALEPLAALEPAHIVVPLGIGNHIDHVETLVAATEWAHERGLLSRLRFYEDFYALAAPSRERHPIASRYLWRPWQAPLLRAPRLSAILRRIARAAKGPAVDRYLVPALRQARWCVTRSDVRQTEERQLAAIECYGSQTRAFGGLAGIAHAIRAFHAWWGGAEPLWHADI